MDDRRLIVECDCGWRNKYELFRHMEHGIKEHHLECKHRIRTRHTMSYEWHVWYEDEHEQHEQIRSYA